MTGWELKDASATLLEDGAELREFLSGYPLAGANEERTLMVIVRRCAPGLNAPPQGEEYDWQLFLVFPGGWSRLALPKGLEYQKVSLEGRTIMIGTDRGVVVTNPSELNSLSPTALPEEFMALSNRQPTPRPPIRQASIVSEVLGEMVPRDFEDWWQGRDLELPFFDHQPLPVVFMGVHPGLDPQFAKDADAALRAFLAKTSADRLRASRPVFDNCQEFMEAVGVNEDNQAMAELQKVEDIWRFVHPQTVYLSRRSRRDLSVYLHISCQCDWEEEHGLQLVFRRGQDLVRVSAEDGHVTESDAYDRPDEEDAMLWAVLRDAKSSTDAA